MVCLSMLISKREAHTTRPAKLFATLSASLSIFQSVPHTSSLLESPITWVLNSLERANSLNAASSITAPKGEIVAGSWSWGWGWG